MEVDAASSLQTQSPSSPKHQGQGLEAPNIELPPFDNEMDFSGEVQVEDDNNNTNDDANLEVTAEQRTR